MNILLNISFDGTEFCGFQVQKNGVSVAETLQNALEAVLGQRPPITGCSRTDAGVHALGYALNFHSDTRIPLYRLPLALNTKLPDTVRVNSARQVPEDFHARYSAHEKTYVYRIRNSAIDSPFDHAYALRFPGAPLDEAAMDRAAQAFVGEHDFSAFCAAGSSAAAHGDTVRRVSAASVRREGSMVLFTVTADGYLYNMVRIMAGTLVEIGAGRMAETAIPGILAGRDRGKAGPTLAARGLFLHSVAYDREEEKHG